MSNIEDRDEQTYLNGFEEQTELPYDWDSEEAQGTAEELRAEAVVNINDNRITVTLTDDGERSSLLVDSETFVGSQYGARTQSTTARSTLLVVDPEAIRAFNEFVNTLYGIQAHA